MEKIYYLSKFTKLVPKALKKVREFRRKHPFDAIAFTGSSGAALSYLLSYQLKVPLVCVRKNGDGSHYRAPLEGVVGFKRYIIVDDLISSGNTIRRISNRIKEDPRNKNSKLVGVVLYDDTDVWRKSIIDAPIVRI